MKTFAKIFYVNFKQLFGGKGMTLFELMTMHTRIFSIIENLHDLVCRGTKDYKQALANVQDYNLTKILTRKCSVPDKSGDIKLNRCDFNILFNVQMDIELYNYFEILMRDYNQGLLTQENLDKDRKKFMKAEENAEKSATRLNAASSFLSMAMQPVGITFKRDNSDVMNNFFINIVSTSFTDIEEILRNNSDGTNEKAIKQTLLDFSKVEKTWKEKVTKQVNQQLQSYDEQINVHNKKLQGVGVETVL